MTMRDIVASHLKSLQRASRNEIVSVEDGYLKIKCHSAPVEVNANKENI